MSVVQKHKAKLDGHITAMKADEAARGYVAFLDWAKEFASYAEDILDQFEKQKEVDDLTKRDNWLTLRIKIQKKGIEVYHDADVEGLLNKGIGDDDYVKKMEDAADKAFDDAQTSIHTEVLTGAHD